MDASCRTSVLNCHFLCVSVPLSHICASEKPKDPDRNVGTAAMPRSMEILILNKDR